MKLFEAIDTELTQGINLYRFIVEKSHIGIFIIDDNHTIIYGNNELVNIRGYLWMKLWEAISGIILLLKIKIR